MDIIISHMLLYASCVNTICDYFIPWRLCHQAANLRHAKMIWGTCGQNCGDRRWQQVSHPAPGFSFSDTFDSPHGRPELTPAFKYHHMFGWQPATVHRPVGKTSLQSRERKAHPFFFAKADRWRVHLLPATVQMLAVREQIINDCECSASSE